MIKFCIEVVCITHAGTTLTIPANTKFSEFLPEDEEFECTLSLKTITVEEFEALPEFTGF